MKKIPKKSLIFFMSAAILCGTITFINVFTAFSAVEKNCPTCSSKDNVVEKTTGTQVNCFYKVADEQTVYYCETCHQYLRDDGSSETLVVIDQQLENITYFTLSVSHSALSSEPAKEPTCAEEGHDAYAHCTACGKYYDSEEDARALTAAESEKQLSDYTREIDPTKHPEMSLSDIPAKDATCMEDGNMAYCYCETCETYYASKADAMTNTSPRKAKTDFTLSKDPALHPEGSLQTTDAKEATCTTAGNVAYVQCTTCSKYYASKEDANTNTKPQETLDTFQLAADPTKHNSELTVTEAKEATCTTPGNQAYVQCPDCHKYYASAEDAANNKNPQENESTFVLAIDPTKHNAVLTPTEAVEATCTTSGHKAFVQCPDCHKYYATAEDAATNTDPQTSEEAFNVGVDPTNHGESLAEVPAKDPTCTESGNNAYWHCSACGQYYATQSFANANKNPQASDNIFKRNPVPGNHPEAQFHHFAETPADCTKDGNQEYWQCEACEKFFATEDDANTGNNAKTSADEFKIEKNPQQHKNLQEYPAIEEGNCTDGASSQAYWYCDGCGHYYETEQDALDNTNVKTKQDLHIGEVNPKVHKNLVEVPAVAATCTEKGHNTYWYCDGCDKYYADADASDEQELTYFETAINPNNHPSELTAYEGTEATCVSGGVKPYWECTACEKYFDNAAGSGDAHSDVADFNLEPDATKHPDALIPHAGVEATCTTDGNQDYWECTACKKFFADEEGATTGYADATHFDLIHTGSEHTDLQAIEAKAATCEEEGYSAYWYCSECGNYYASLANANTNTAPQKDTSLFIKPKDATNHTQLQVVPEVVPTCQTGGNVEYCYCEGCGKYYNSTENAEANLYPQDNAENFTLDADAENHTNLQAVEAKDATCAETGNNKYYYCDGCDKYFADEAGTEEHELSYFEIAIDAENHSNLQAVEAKDATCAETGNSKYYYCDGCDKYFADEAGTEEHELSYFEVAVDAENHTNLQAVEAKAATCTEAGNSAYWYCDGCEKYYEDAACTKETTLEKTIIKAAGHKATAVEAKAATCTEAGNSAYWHCAACNKYFSDAACTKEITLASTVIAAGHKATAVEAKAATTTTDGNIAYWSCTVCGKYFSDAACTTEITLADTVIPATGTPAATTPEENGTWIQDSTGWWYRHDDGSYQTSGWESVNDTWYYFDETGYMETGWVLDGSTWYYMDESGAMETGWVLDGPTWYYMDESGAMETGWVLDGSTWYYMDESGAMETGWILLNGTWYYLQANGAMATGWLNDGGTWYYLQESGAMATGWIQLGGTWYYLQANGAMVTGWLNDGGTWYYLQESGAMASNTYVGPYYVNASGAWVQ